MSEGVPPSTAPRSAKLEAPASHGSWRPPASQRLQPGTIFAERYTIDDLIGEGATGTVYAARRNDDNQPVALKVIHAHLVGNRQVNRRFHREAEVLRQLTTPHIVRVQDFGEDASGLLFLALERLKGEQLGTIISREIELPMSHVAAIFRGICSALAEAHAAGVIHRDLKPDNVVVERLGDVVVRVAVLDFGLSKMLRGRTMGSTNLTEENMVLGTPEYMAPEQARGDEVDDRCDIYAAGVILYLLLTGRVPFKHKSPVAIMTAHLTQDPSPPTHRPSGSVVPSSLVAVVMHALAKRRRDRYPDAAALAGAFETAMTTPDDPRSVHPPAPQRDSVPDRDTIGHADTLPVVSGLSEPPKPVPASTERPSSRVWIAIAVIAGVVGVVAGVLLSWVL